MHPRCNKCKVGFPAEGDSWCTGCSGLELAQSLLCQRWQSPGVRKVAEEVLVTSARLVRAFANLDRGWSSAAAGTRAESARPPLPPPPPVPDREERPRERERTRDREKQRSRRPRSGERSERPRSSDRRERSPLERGGRSQELHPKRVARPPSRTEDAEEYTEEDSEEEYREDDRSVPGPPPEVKSEQGHLPPPEPRDPPRKKRSTKKKKKRRRRAGRRHQRHYREQDQPLKRSHRKLRGAVLELSSSARHALTRQI